MAHQVPGAQAGPAPVARVALPPAPTTAELDDREVPGEGESDRPALAGRQVRGGGHGGTRWSVRGGSGTGHRVRVESTIGGEVRPEFRVGHRIERSARGERPALGLQGADRHRAPQRGRRSVTGIVERHAQRLSCPNDLVRPSGRRPVVGTARRIRPGEEKPDRQRVGPGILHPPLEDPDGQGAPLEVAGDDRRELLADQPDAEPGIVRLERLPGAREQRVVGATADGQVPTPGRQLGRAVGGQHGRRARAVALRRGPARRTARSHRPRPARTGGGRPRDASARHRRGTSARCSPSRGRRSAPRPTRRRRPSAGRLAGGRHRGRGYRCRVARPGAGWSASRCRAWRRRRGGPSPSLVDPRHDDPAHEGPLRQEEHDDRHRDREDRAGLDEGRPRHV